MKLSENTLLFNGDCTYLFSQHFAPKNGERYSCNGLHRYIDLLAASGVDIYLQNPNVQKPFYPSRVLSPAWEGCKRGDDEFVRGHCPYADPPLAQKCIERHIALLNRYLDLKEDGVDWMREISLACRLNKIAPWISIRMNDMHGAVNWEKSYMNCDLQKDARYRLNGPVPLLNYEHQEVRDYYFSMIRELVEDYDYQGLELDWLRSPFCCESPATPQALDVMTRWISQIRALTNRQVQKTGRPFPLGLRIPVRLDELKMIGLDVQAWAREELIDFIAPSNLFQTTWDVPYEKLRLLLGNNVAIYGVVEDAPNWLGCRVSPQLTHPHAELDTSPSSHRCLSASAELLRGNAAGKLALGADGIYLCNFFCTDEPVHNPTPGKAHANYAAVNNLHRLDKLRGQPKHYTLSTSGDPRTYPVFEFADQLPMMLGPGEQHLFRIPMCAETEESLELWIQLVIERCPNEPMINISFNGNLFNNEANVTDELLFPTGIFTHHLPEHQAMNFRFPAQLIQEGWNTVTVVRRKSDSAQAALIHILSLELAIKDKSPSH